MRYLFVIFVLMSLIVLSGCPDPDRGGDELVTGKGPYYYAAGRIHILGLTSIEADPDSGSSATISAYVSLYDRFDSIIKGPGVFRFELYEYVPRTGDNRGKRLYSWPEFDLEDAVVNNSYWKDVLRAYKFSLKTSIKPDVPGVYVLQVTCLSPAGKRLTDIFYLKSGSD